MARMFAEALESRRLFSFVGPSTVFDSAVRADQLHIIQDFTKFKKDAIHANSAMTRDAAHIKSSNLSQAPTVKGLVASFDLAMLQARAGIEADHLVPTKAILTDEKAIIAEQKKLAHDHADPTAVAADQTQLTADRAQIKTDLDSFIQARFTSREDAYNAILTDANSIVTAVQADTQASAGLTAASTQLSTDATNAGTTLSDDLEQAGTDSTQLDTDLTASA